MKEEDNQVLEWEVSSSLTSKNAPAPCSPRLLPEAPQLLHPRYPSVTAGVVQKTKRTDEPKSLGDGYEHNPSLTLSHHGHPQRPLLAAAAAAGKGTDAAHRPPRPIFVPKVPASVPSGAIPPSPACKPGPAHSAYPVLQGRRRRPSRGLCTARPVWSSARRSSSGVSWRKAGRQNAAGGGDPRPGPDPALRGSAGGCAPAPAPSPAASCATAARTRSSIPRPAERSQTEPSRPNRTQPSRDPAPPRLPPRRDAGGAPGAAVQRRSASPHRPPLSRSRRRTSPPGWGTPAVIPPPGGGGAVPGKDPAPRGHEPSRRRKCSGKVFSRAGGGAAGPQARPVHAFCRQVSLLTGSSRGSSRATYSGTTSPSGAGRVVTPLALSAHARPFRAINNQQQGRTVREQKAEPLPPFHPGCCAPA